MDSEHSLPWRQMLAEPQEMILMQKAVGTKGYKVNYCMATASYHTGFPRPRTTSGTSKDGSRTSMTFWRSQSSLAL